MKKILAALTGIAFITLMTLSVNAQEPQKKTTETKAKTEKCTKDMSKCCQHSCDKMKEEKKAEAKKAEETKKEEKKEEKKK